MAREILKKNIDQDVQTEVDSDDHLFEQMEKEYDQVSMTGGNIKMNLDVSSIDAFSSDPSKASFSLDDFESAIDKGSDLIEKEEPSPETVPTPARDASKPEEPRRRKFDAKKLIAIGSGALVVVILLAAAGAHLLNRKPKAKPPPKVVTQIKQPIVISYFEDQFEFLFLANAQRESDLVSVGIEFRFPAVNAFEDFQKDNVVFRDVVYQYLQGERPVRNSQKYWQQIIESQLLNYLKSIFPNSGLASTRLVYLDRL